MDTMLLLCEECELEKSHDRKKKDYLYLDVPVLSWFVWNQSPRLGAWKHSQLHRVLNQWQPHLVRKHFDQDHHLANAIAFLKCQG